MKGKLCSVNRKKSLPKCRIEATSKVRSIARGESRHSGVASEMALMTPRLLANANLRERLSHSTVKVDHFARSPYLSDYLMSLV